MGSFLSIKANLLLETFCHDYLSCSSTKCADAYMAMDDGQSSQHCYYKT